MLAAEPQMAACCSPYQHSPGCLWRHSSYCAAHCLLIHQGPLLHFCTHCSTPVPVTAPARSGCLHKVWQFFLTQHIKGPYPTGQQYTHSQRQIYSSGSPPLSLHVPLLFFQSILNTPLSSHFCLCFIYQTEEGFICQCCRFNPLSEN